MKDKFVELCAVAAVSGHEQNFCRLLEEMFARDFGEAKTDAVGNVIGIKRCKKPGAKKIMLDAHIDQIGLMVKEIDDRGFLKFVAMGGVDPRILPAREVTVHGKTPLYGVIGTKAPHLQKPGETDKAYKIDELYIDVGMPREQVEKAVSIGDVVTFFGQHSFLLNDRVSSRATDDRAGLFTIMQAAARAKCENADIYIVASVQEEAGEYGAGAAAFGIMPDLAIVVDVTHGTTPDSEQYRAFELGCGAVIGRGPNLHLQHTKDLIKCAKDAGLPHNIEVEPRDFGTNAWPIQIAGTGVATLLVSIPQRYMHTPVETVDMGDIETCIDLISRYIEKCDRDWGENG